MSKEDSLDIAVDLEFQSLINSLGYDSFLNTNRPLSLIDIILSGNAIAERFQVDPFNGLDGFCYLEEQVERYIANQFGDPYKKNWQDRRCGGR